MIIYWSMYLVPALLTLNQTFSHRRIPIGSYWLLFALLMVLVGLRETGGDYPTYKVMFQIIAGSTFADALKVSDPGYVLVNWVSNQLHFGMYGVNTVCGLTYFYGFYRFARREPEPILMLTISIAYQVIVTVMGYTRQGAAVGLLMWGIPYLYERKPVRFLVFSLLAASFHSSAIVFMPLAYFGFNWRTQRLASFFAVVGLALAVYLGYRTLHDRFSSFYDNYIESKHYSSQGALIRSSMTALAAAMFLGHWRRWGRAWNDRRIWLAFALAALAMVPLTFTASTAADRIGLYLIPLQLVVFARLPALQRTRGQHDVWVMAILAGYAASLGVWLYFGQFTSVLWLPYKSLILGEVR